jgi:aryl-alcohol dehydrogenase-like predicted oxidoreductase/adenylate kinase family enzyme
MRLSTELAGDEPAALATLAAALDAGVALFDTARAYAPGETDLGHNERLIAKAWRARSAVPAARVVTKCGMRRDGGAWIPDGRAKRIADDVAASVEALGGVPIDVLLLHAPDPRVPLATAGRALARAYEDGIVRAVGVSNVSRKQLQEIAAHAPISAVEIALGAYDDLAIRSGVVSYCLEHGIEVLAHTPLGGPERAARLAKDPVLAGVARRFEGAGAVEVFLAYLLAVRPGGVPIVGARRPETIARFRAAAALELGEEDLVAIDGRFPRLGELRRPRVVPFRDAVHAPDAVHASDAEVVVLMGVPGAGKSRAAERFVKRGYERLNRDIAGGTLRAIAQTLDERLRAGVTRLVLDNTYVTRATRSDVVRFASSHGARVRCVFLETPLPEAQVNVVLRMIERFGRVVEPEDMTELARTDPAALAPHALSRMMRDLEPPAADEGFADIEVVPFVRDLAAGGNPGIAIAIDALENPSAEEVREVDIVRRLDDVPLDAPCLLYAWRLGAGAASRAAEGALARRIRATGRTVEIAVCPHPAGPPICWCRPPLPAMLLMFAARHHVNLHASTLFGRSPTDQRVALVLGMSFAEIGGVNRQSPGKPRSKNLRRE